MQDMFFMPDHVRGPFKTIRSFHDWVFATATRQQPGDDGIIQGLDHPDMYRGFLPDTGTRVYFTHGDLNLGNIMVTGSPGTHRITAILDWEQAGWYPEHWEYCKMCFGAAGDEEWTTDDWPEKILEVHEDAWWAFGSYTLWRGGG